MLEHEAADGGRRLRARDGLPARHQLEEGGRARQGPGEGEGRQRHQGDRRSRPRSPRGSSTSSPSRRARTASTSSPGGEYIIVSGKLDPHVTVYSVEKIKKAIDDKNFDGKDPFGVPILKYDACLEAHVPTGLGPLHTVFDDKGNGYTSLFLDSTVAKWTLGPPYNPPEQGVEGRRQGLGPLQHRPPAGARARTRASPTASISSRSTSGRSIASRRSARCTRRTCSSSTSAGPRWCCSRTRRPSASRTTRRSCPIELLQAVDDLSGDRLGRGQDEALRRTPRRRARSRSSRNGNIVTVNGTVIRSHYTPDIVRVKEGDKVVFHWTNVETARDATHGFGLHGYNVNLSIDPGATETRRDRRHQGGRLSLLLHRVLLRAAHGDDGLAAGGAEGAHHEDRRRRSGRAIPCAARTRCDLVAARWSLAALVGWVPALVDDGGARARSTASACSSCR